MTLPSLTILSPKQWPATVVTLVAALSLIAVATFRIHVRVQTTLVGYEIGRLKSDEAKLLEQRSTLRMQLAKLTTKKHLQLMTDAEDRSASPVTYAQK